MLAGANMPAVLVEVGFLTNPDEEQQLLSEVYQGTVAQAILDGMLRFRDARGPAATAAERGARAAPGARPEAPMTRALRRDRARRAHADARRGLRGRVRRVPRWYAETGEPPVTRRAAAAPATPKIKARLFYVVRRRPAPGAAVEREVPFGEGTLTQARRIVEAQLERPAPPLVSPSPTGTTLRAIYRRRAGAGVRRPEPRGVVGAPGRRARRDSHGILHRQRRDRRTCPP